VTVHDLWEHYSKDEIASARRRNLRRWQRRWRDGTRDPRTGRLKQFKAAYPESQRAQALLDDARQLGQPRATRIARSSITVATLLERHLAARVDRAPKTVEADTYHAGVVTQQFGDRVLSTLDTTEIEIWSQRADVARSSRKKQVEILRAAIRRGMKDKLVDEDPTEGVVVALGHREKAHWALEELLAVADAADAGMPRTLLLTLGLMGLRIGEARALRVGDLKDGSLTVVNSGGGSDQTKTRAGKRVLPVPASLLVRLVALADDRPRSGWLFASPRRPGQPIGETYANGLIARAVTKANRTRTDKIERLNVHGLRHTFAAITLSELGGDLLSVSRALGHAKPSITLNEYGHLAPNGLAPLMAQLDALVVRTHPEPGAHSGRTDDSVPGESTVSRGG